MKNGYYFSTDPASDQASNRSVPPFFRYHCFPDNQTTEETLRHPIYLSISPQGVHFYLHALGDLHSEHGAFPNIRLFSLLHDSQEELTHVLRSLFDSSFDFFRTTSTDRRTGYLTGYSSLPEFGIGSFEMEYDPVEKSRVSQESPPKFLRKLLLDFLFDCRHSTLFQQNEHFDQVFQSLQSNLLFRAISAKSDYEYGRNNFQHCNKGDQVRIRHALQLQEAERRWLNVIRAVESPEVFSLSNGWLSEVEEEYARVMFADSEKPKTSAPAYNRRAWQRLLESSQANHPSRQTNTRHLSNLIIKDSVFWFLRRYSLRHALGILLGCTLRRATWLWNGFLTWIAVALITFWASGFFPSPAQKTLLGVALILLLLPPLVFLVLLGYHRIRRTGVLMPEGVVAMLLPRLLIALGSVWITYSVFDGMDSTPLENFYRFLLLQGIALLFVLYSIHRVLSYRKTGFRPLLIRAGGLMLMTLWSGVLTGVLYIDFTHADQLKQVNHLESYFHSIRDELPDRMKDDETKDSVMQIVGPRGKLTYGEKEQLMAALVEVSRDKQDDLRVAFDYEFLWFQFRVYPGTTLHHVCWVVFFGLFFQLLFQEKPVTEPI